MPQLQPLCRTEGLNRLRGRRTLHPQSFQIVEFTDLGPKDVDDHVTRIDQHPIAIGQAFDMGIFDATLFETLGDIFRNRANVPVNPAGGDDHVVGICRFAAKVDGDRFFRLHIVEAGEDQFQGLVGVWLRLQGRSFGRCFTRGFGCGLLRNLG